MAPKINKEKVVVDDTPVIDTDTQEPIDTTDAPVVDSEPTKLTSVAEVMNAAKQDGSVPPESEAESNTPPEEIKPELVEEPAKFNKEAISELVKNKNLGLMSKLEEIAKLLPQPASKVVLGLRGLYDIRANHSANSVALNAEQRSFYRNFKALLKLPQNEFNEVYRYVDWAYKQLINVEVLNNEKLNLVSNVSPLHIMNIFLYIANKDDIELQSFIYLFTIIDARATDVENKLQGKSINTARATVKTTLNEEDTEKINKYYNAD